jgi:hypothetical protein
MMFIEILAVHSENLTKEICCVQNEEILSDKTGVGYT